MRVAFLSEGPTEVHFSRGAPSEEPWRHRFLLQILVERILDAEGQIEPLAEEELPFILGSVAGELWKRGAKLVRECWRSGAEAAVILVDRDRTPHGDRMRKLEAQRQKLRNEPRRGLAMPVAIGVAIETIEAWLLADEMALCEVLGIPNPEHPMGSPEKLGGKPGQHDHPKCVLNQKLACDSCPERSFLDRVAAVARRMDLSVVEMKCPEGFGAFREDVVRELGGSVGRR